ncbi:MAG: leucyl/phenylalanyl-tRNA--protein transferase [Deltaproteobacteria bacterium]|nr:leucyl/phenylalanyl-tRNA--protein transferase [Deltaproteobacteria bacterium]
MSDAPSAEEARFSFPDPDDADEDGVVAVGGPLDPYRILAAYRRGIFPWSGRPVRWYSPDPRAIFWQARLPRKLGKMARKGGFGVTYDRDFEGVIRGCLEAHRDEGVWITPAFIAGYTGLHRLGYAHSVEVWQGDELVGGLYGVQLQGLFSGESMFFRVSNASKVAFAALVARLGSIGTVLVDCQSLTEHTYRLGAGLVRRADYLRLLSQALRVRCLYAESRWPEALSPEEASWLGLGATTPTER